MQAVTALGFWQLDTFAPPSYHLGCSENVGIFERIMWMMCNMRILVVAYVVTLYA